MFLRASPSSFLRKEPALRASLHARTRSRSRLPVRRPRSSIPDPSRSAAARPPRPLPLERQRTQPLAPRAGRPDGCHTPLCAEGAGPYGNTGKHRPADWYLMPSISLTILTETLRFAQDDGCPAGLPGPDPDLGPPHSTKKRAAVSCSSFCSYSSTGYTLTCLLSLPRRSKAILPSAVAKSVSSLPILTFRPGWRWVPL